MQTVSVLEAEGMVLCHDITEIVPGKFKGSIKYQGVFIVKASASAPYLRTALQTSDIAYGEWRKLNERKKLGIE